MTADKKATIVIPVYNDWMAVERLIEEIGREGDSLRLLPAILLVNDGSSTDAPDEFLQKVTRSGVHSVEILDLVFNMGHQRAIALGLSHIVEGGNIPDLVVVMDSDGEDRVEDIRSLIEASEAYGGHIVVAERKQRSEGIVFKACYFLYKLLFRLLTGTSVTFGNFSLIPGSVLGRFILLPDIWNNLAAAILKSRFPVVRVPTRRGTRYAGRSSMNFISLITHGLSAIAVFRENVFVRLITIGALTGFLMLIGILIVVMIRIWTDWAIPGWASYMVSFLLVILLQAGLTLIIAVLLSLGDRSRDPVTLGFIHSRLVATRRRIL